MTPQTHHYWPSARATEILSKLARIGTLSSFPYSFRTNPYVGDKLAYFPSDLNQELRQWSPDPFRYYANEGEVDGPRIVIFHSDGGPDEANRIWDLRQTMGPDAVIVLWMWDNHTAYIPNVHSAQTADLVFYSHSLYTDYLHNPASAIAGHVPACSAQWGHDEAAALFQATTSSRRRHSLLVNYVRYDFASERNAVITSVRENIPEATVLTMPATDRKRYFQLSSQQRFVEWAEHKATLILPVRNDLSTRLFDAMLCGLVPIVPTNISDIDLLISEEDQQRLGIVRINSYDIDEIRLATQSALQNYDRLGPEGALARHRFVLDHHMLVNRIAALLQMIYMLISGNLDIRLRNDRSGPALLVQPTARPPEDEASDVAPPSSFLILCNDHGLLFSAPASLDCMSSYVLLEQGRWFEKEIDFLYDAISPGMTVVDIGANIGMYSLALASLVGPHGKVIAYEPGTENRRHLAHSLQLNRLDNVTLSAAALSDTEGHGMLEIGDSGEFNMLISLTDPSTNTESVKLTTLDAEFALRNWSAVDFIKIDAEGQEYAILQGGKDFFALFDPLVMFEIKHGLSINDKLIEAFNELGYQTYRLLGDGSALVAVDPGAELDGFELNCFAAKPALAARLAEKGLLIPSVHEDWTLSDSERRSAIERYCALPFAESLGISSSDVENCPFADALTCYAAYRLLPGLNPQRRFALLQKAYSLLADFTTNTGSAAALATLARVGLDLGHRGGAIAALISLINDPDPELDQPFFPPAERFESSSADAVSWFGYAVGETLELNQGYSTFCFVNHERLGWLAQHPLASSNILRRWITYGLRSSRPRSELLTLMARLGVPVNSYEKAWSDAVLSLMGTA